MEAITVVAALAVMLVCSFCVFACYRHVGVAQDVAHDLRSARAKVIAQEAMLGALEAKVDKLGARLRSAEGYYHATKVPLQPSTDVKRVEAVPACENWLQAQIDGPRSTAASCECDYCTEQREQRAREKAAILALHAKGAPRPRSNGSE